MEENVSAMLDFIIERASQLSAGDREDAVCPMCGGALLIEKSSYNGHLHAYCDGCKFVLME